MTMSLHRFYEFTLNAFLWLVFSGVLRLIYGQSDLFLNVTHCRSITVFVGVCVCVCVEVLRYETFQF